MAGRRYISRRSQADADHAEMKDVEQDIAFTVDAGSTEEELRGGIEAGCGEGRI